MKRLFYLAVTLMCAISVTAAQPAAATGGQPPDQLQRQLEELKQQYVETTRSLEQRIAALEQQIEKAKEAAAAPKQGKVSVA